MVNRAIPCRATARLSAGIVAAIGLWLGAVGAASAAPEAKGEAAITNDGLAACYDAATSAAFRDIVVMTIDREMGGYRPGRHAAVADDADRFIRRHKVRSKRDLGTGICQVVVAARLDSRALEKALAEGGVGGAQVGIVLRYVIDDELAEAQGVSPLSATRALGDILARQKCELVDLTHQHDLFSKRMRPVFQAISDGTEGAQYEENSFAGSVMTVLRNMRELLAMDIGIGSKGFDRILIGDLRVEGRGPNPDGPGHIAQARVSATVHRLSNDATIAEGAAGLDAAGTTQDAAWEAAMRGALHHLVRRLSQQAPICDVG